MSLGNVLESRGHSSELAFNPTKDGSEDKQNLSLIIFPSNMLQITDVVATRIYRSTRPVLVAAKYLRMRLLEIQGQYVFVA